jgi:hypothetical protein
MGVVTIFFLFLFTVISNAPTIAQCIFWLIFVRFRIKYKIELFKKTIDILNYKAHGVTKIIFKIKFLK